jgi:multidrug efflux pump subunit AcrA (membrane-fusion protein)
MSQHQSRAIRLGGACLFALLSMACAQVAPVAIPALPAGSGSDVLSRAQVNSTSAATPDAAIQVDDSLMPEAPEGAEKAEQALAAVTPISPAARGTVAVRRGSIAEVLQVNGRVEGVGEVELSFPVDGTLKIVAAEVGQAVQAGQVLAELDSRQLAREVDAARDRVETARIRLDQAHARVAAQQWDAQQRTATESERAAEQAAANVRAAELAVATARANLDRAQADLARLAAPPSPMERQAAEQQIAAAQVALQRAEAEQERLRRGPDPAAVRAAEREVATAQAAFNAAQAEISRVAQGADPYELRAAERQLEQALINLTVETTPPPTLQEPLAPRARPRPRTRCPPRQQPRRRAR